MQPITSGIIKNNSNKFATIYRGIDLFFITLSFALVCYMLNVSFDRDYLLLSLLGSITFALIAESFSLYRSWRVGTFKEMSFYTFVSWAFSIAILVVGLFLFEISDSFSRLIISAWFVVTCFTLIAWRFVFKNALSSLRGKGFNTRNIALFGLSEKGIRLAKQAQNNPEIGYNLTAIYDDRDITRLDKKYHDLVQGTIDDGIAAARNNNFDVIYIALPIAAHSRIQDILSEFGDTTATVHVVPDLFMYCLMHGQMANLGDMQTISVYDNPMSGGMAVIKRLEDIVLSIFALALLCLPMLAIAALIKLTSKGPIIFKQNRYGMNGRPIKVWKFRTMQVLENDAIVTQAKKGDPRITVVGSFLRKTSLDELPQFFNSLKGDMSVIGPRPHAVSHNETYRKLINYYMLRHKVKPGITGWAQVNGWRGETDTLDKMQKRVEFDLEYIRNWSLWMDFKILIFTVLRSFRDKNAY
jgi:putative colanic acid biosynthesis UDP-glucose lipid carrier transferase